MNNILVTGAAGFIGQRTVELLINSGYQVIGLDNINDYYDTRLKLWRINQLKKNKNFSFIKCDIEDFKKLTGIFKKYKFDAVINLAARAGVRYSMENPFVYFKTNVEGTLNLLELMKLNKINKFVLASTSSLYAGLSMPFNESLPVNTPISPYAASKKSAEVLCYTYNKLYNFDITILRYFTVYGPASRPDMAPLRFLKCIDENKPIEVYGDGNQARDFTYIDDIASGTVKALKLLNYEIINLGGGNKPYTINYMIKKYEELLGKKAIINIKDFHKADMKETWADIKKANDILNWKPKVDFDEGLKRTVDWYLSNKKWLKNIRL
jgi:nucleoside-diphosphate-sugar epimerase